MRDALIIEAVRTPIGRRKGALSDWHPADLLSEVLAAVVSRAGVLCHLPQAPVWYP